MNHARLGRTHVDPYRVLGVSVGASQQDITRAYRRAVQHAHPDAQPHDPQAVARFRALTDAYELLRDPGRRADYDRYHPAPEPSPGGTRRYSTEDIGRLHQIVALTSDGLNLAGVRRVLELQEETRRLQAEIDQLKAAARRATPS